MNDDFLSTPQDKNSPRAPAGFPGYVFLNETGLRAGWRLLIYVAISVLLWVVSIFLLRLLLRPALGVSSSTVDFLGELASFLAAFLAALIMSRLEARPMGVYGLPAQQAFGKLFWLGCVFGLAEITIMIGLIAALGGYSFGTLAEHGAAIVKWGLYWGLFFLVVALFEEFFFRGYTLY